MDTRTPLDPYEFESLRVSTMTRSEGPAAVICTCRVCRREYGVLVTDDGLCNHPRCWQLARALGWIG